MPDTPLPAMDFLLTRRSRPAKTLTTPVPDRTALIPILNVSLASKDIFAGVINPFYMIEVYLSLFGFAVISVLVCARAFNDENTLFRN